MLPVRSLEVNLYIIFSPFAQNVILYITLSAAYPQLSVKPFIDVNIDPADLRLENATFTCQIPARNTSDITYHFRWRTGSTETSFTVTPTEGGNVSSVLPLSNVTAEDLQGEVRGSPMSHFEFRNCPLSLNRPCSLSPPREF